MNNDDFNKICVDTLSKSKVAQDYLINRGITQETIDEFSLGFCPASIRPDVRDTDKEWMLHRITIPVRDTYGDIIAFVGRSIDGRKPKYINTHYEKSNFYYNLDKAKESIVGLGYVVIVEGNMDAISLYMAGIHNVVALCGLALKARRVALLSRYTDKVILILDNDKAGKEAAPKISKTMLDSGMSVKYIYLGKYKDADEVLHSPDCDKFKIKIKTCYDENEDNDIENLQDKLDQI